MRRGVRVKLQKAGLAMLSALHADEWYPPGILWNGGVLMLHRVRPQPDHPFQPNANLEITPDFLDRALTILRRRKVLVVSLEEAADRLRRGLQDERYVAVTLDDGYRDNHDHAWPVFRAHEAPFTVFVATGMVDRTANAWWMTIEEVVRRNDEVVATFPDGDVRFASATPCQKRKAFLSIAGTVLAMDEPGREAVVRPLAAAHGFSIADMLAREMMDWDQVRAMSAGPLSSVGGHTVSHPALARLSDADAETEIRGGLDRLEAMTGRRPTTFAYPYGDDDAVSCRDVRLAARFGFSVAVTTRRGMLRPEHACMNTDWPRLSLNGHFQSDREFEILLSGVPFALERLGWRSLPFLRPTGRAALPARSA
ncbi:polysaccharide deacetylase family protein [Chthonobacter albigriseus]|uniref:polysaccharide deacetylase family protein n=1 Tax=Chthonobacter albigriseus TaxID=1683161 RepID=UPI0015EEAAAB|nr:polysaccharide deacetylase family protein [Chthonobacter albigriseus]